MVDISGLRVIDVTVGNRVRKLLVDANSQVEGWPLQDFVSALELRRHNQVLMAASVAFHVRVVVFDWESNCDRAPSWLLGIFLTSVASRRRSSAVGISSFISVESSLPFLV